MAVAGVRPPSEREIVPRLQNIVQSSSMTMAKITLLIGKAAQSLRLTPRSIKIVTTHFIGEATRSLGLMKVPVLEDVTGEETQYKSRSDSDSNGWHRN